MRIGELRTLVRVERQEEDFGLGIARRWQPTGAKLWASIEQLSGSELLAAQQLEARATHKARTHWRADIKPSDRLVAEASGTIYHITSVNNVLQLNRELELMCTEAPVS